MGRIERIKFTYFKVYKWHILNGKPQKLEEIKDVHIMQFQMLHLQSVQTVGRFINTIMPARNAGIIEADR